MAYIVKAGDTLFDIAASFYGNGNLYPQIVAANPQITDPNLIRVGDVINIPGAEEETAVTTTSSSSASASVNKQVILLAGLAVAGALAYWYFVHRKPTVSANPESEE